MVLEYIARLKTCKTFSELGAAVISGAEGTFFMPVTALNQALLADAARVSEAESANTLWFRASDGRGNITLRATDEMVYVSASEVSKADAYAFARVLYDTFFLSTIRMDGIAGLENGQYSKAALKEACLGSGVGAELILTAGPSISDLEKAYAADAVENGWNSQWNKYLTRFEAAFSSYVGVEHAMATSSCTGALHIALAALGIGPGDEVIVPDITWVATANAVLYVGATPVFADVDPNTWCIDPASAAQCVSPKTKAIMPVHLYGHPCDMDAILALAEKHHLYVVEDAAPSIGAEYKGRRTGSFGHFAAFSFQGAKLAVTGEGGMLVTNDSELYKRAYAIWDQGRTPGTFWIETNGLKYKMSNVQAAIGLGQIQRNDAMVAAKRRIHSWYKENLSGVGSLRLFDEASWAKSIHWMSSIQLTDGAKVTRDDVINQLKQRNIDSRPVFPAISQYAIWPRRQDPMPNARKIGANSINLPSGVCLTRAEVDYVCDQLIDILK